MTWERQIKRDHIICCHFDKAAFCLSSDVDASWASAMRCKHIITSSRMIAFLAITFFSGQARNGSSFGSAKE